MSSRAILLSCLFATAIAGCSRSGGAAARDEVRVYVDEDPKDPQNLKKLHVGTITIAPAGGLALSMEKEIPPASDRLRKAVTQLQSRKSLKVSREVEQEVGGRKVTVMQEFDVPPTDPVYRHALMEALQMEFGLDAR